MKKNRNQSTDTAKLRRRAEKRLKRQRPEGGRQKTALESARLVHELEVHQIELEMQNEELQRTRAKAEALLAQYTDLYDFAPTATSTSPRTEPSSPSISPAPASLASSAPSSLNRRFGVLVSEADRPIFNAFLAKTFAGKDRESCEVALLKAETAPLFVHVEAVVSEGRRECRAAMLDVTDRYQTEAERDQLIQELQQALASVKSLSGLLPICASCKKIRDDQGYWKQVEAYISSHSEATLLTVVSRVLPQALSGI